MLDYAHSFGLKTCVFRMSCIYGTYQLGSEDQGWVAHFLRQAMKREPITIYGDGKQVRDLLFVEDLVVAMRLAHANMKLAAGQAFNIGGGPKNATSLLDLLQEIGRLTGSPVATEWGPSDWQTSAGSWRTLQNSRHARVAADGEHRGRPKWLFDFYQSRPSLVERPAVQVA